MAERILLYYKHITEALGMAGRLRLAVETKIPSTEAALAPDSKENLQKFSAAFEKLTGKPAPRI